jgi:hypothetical protein
MGRTQLIVFKWTQGNKATLSQQDQPALQEGESNQGAPNNGQQAHRCAWPSEQDWGMDSLGLILAAKSMLPNQGSDLIKRGRLVLVHWEYPQTGLIPHTEGETGNRPKHAPRCWNQIADNRLHIPVMEWALLDVDQGVQCWLIKSRFHFFFAWLISW